MILQDQKEGNSEKGIGSKCNLSKVSKNRSSVIPPCFSDDNGVVRKRRKNIEVNMGRELDF